MSFPLPLGELLGHWGAYGVYLVIGIAFGAVLEIAGFGNSKKLAAQFYFKDMTVLKVMFGSIVVAMVLIFACYSGKQRIAAFGIFGAVQASGAAAGPILGGFLTTFLTWRVGFGMHVAIMLAALLIARTIAETDRKPEVKLDLVGTALSALGLAMVVLGILLGGRYGFFEARRPLVIAGTEIDLFGLSPTPLLILAGVIVLVGFVHWQQRLHKSGGVPLIRVAILSNARFMTSTATDAIRQLALAGLLFVVPVYAQSALGFSAVESGLAILPFSATVFILSMTTAGLSTRIAPKWLVLGGLGFFWIGIVYLRAVTDAGMEIADFILPMTVMGLGIGLFVAQIVNLTISQVDTDQRNEGSGAHNTFRELGSSLGTAIIGAVLIGALFGNLATAVARSEGVDIAPAERQQLAVQLEDSLAEVAPEDGDAWIDGLPAEQQAALAADLAEAQVGAMKDALTWSAGFVLLSLLLATFLPGRSKQEHTPKPGARAALK